MTTDQKRTMSQLFGQSGRLTPLQAARALAKIFADRIPATHTDAIGWDFRNGINAYNFCKMIQEQSRCSFRAASVAGCKAAPTLWAPE